MRCAPRARLLDDARRRCSQRHVEADGRAIGGRAVLRLKDADRRASASSPSSPPTIEQLRRDIDSLRTLIEALPSPVWARDAPAR